MSGDMMPKQQYDFIKGIQDNMLEASNMTEDDAWRFGFLIWQHQEWICKYLIDRTTESTGYNLSPLDKGINVRSKDEPTTQTETQNSNLTFKTLEYCDICDHKGCEECIANALDEHCMPSQFNKQIEDECAKEYEELGLKELKELIEADRKTEPSNSEKPNNCEHITEDGVTCAKYPACDDCLDNPLNKVKGSERLVKGSDESQPEPSGYKTKPVEDEPQTCSFSDCDNFKNPDYARCIECKRKQIMPKDEPQTDCARK